MTALASVQPGEVLPEAQPILSEPRWRGRMGMIRAAMLGVVWAGITTFLAYVGYFAIYSYFGPYDDEGYWLISLRSYHLHGSLYHDTFSQAGPLYYEIWSLVYSLFDMPINWDTGRLLTLVVWIGTSVLMGIGIWVLSKRALLGLLAQVVSFLVLFLLSSVSMEPAGLAHLFGAVVLLGLALYLRGKHSAAMVLIGVGSTAAIFTKVNIGAFIVAGLVAAVALTWRSRKLLHAHKVVVASSLLLLPILIMAQVLQAQWAWHYCMLEVLYLIALCAILLSGNTSNKAQVPSAREICLVLATAAGSAALITVGIVANGTSLWQFIVGAFFSQRGLAQAFLHQRVVPLPISAPEVITTILSSALALFIGLWTFKRGDRHPWFSSVVAGYLRLAAGFWILLSIVQGFAGWMFVGLVLGPRLSTPVPGMSFLLAAPFAWIAVLGGRDEENDHRRFVRVAICVIGVLACLEGFPVAGAQMLWASLGLVPVGVLCIIDGLSLIPQRKRNSRRAFRIVVPSLGTVLVASLTLSLVLGTGGRTLSIWRNAHSKGESLGLLGAVRVRLPRPEVDQFRVITQFLKANCSTYWSIPGLNSFYFFSGETPPTGLNSTQSWWNALSWNQQHSVLTALVHTPRLCLIEGYGYLDFQHIIQTPLVRYVETAFVASKATGAYGPYSYELLVRRSHHDAVHPDK